MIRELGNVELFELCETTPKVQCSHCLLCWNQGIVYCTCGQCLMYSESRRKFYKLRLDANRYPGLREQQKALPMVLDTAKSKYKENTTWLGMRGRDAARKLTLKVNILQVFTIDFSEIQFIVNHNSQSDGQNNSAKSGMNLRKKTIHTNSLQRKREDTKDNGILLWTKQAKMGLWNFDLMTEPLSWWKIVYTTNQENQLKTHSSKSTKTHTTRTRNFLRRLLVQRSSWSTYWMATLAFTSKFLVVVRIEWSWMWAHNFFCSNISFFVTVGFVYSWWRSTVIDGRCEQNTLTPRIFSHICTHFILADMHS